MSGLYALVYGFEAKKNLYSAIMRNLAKSPGTEGKDILVVINEPPLENWGVKADYLLMKLIWVSK